MEDEEEGLGHALVVHDAEDGVGMDPSEHVVDGELVVDHRGGWGPPVGGHPDLGIFPCLAREREGPRRAGLTLVSW